MAKLGLQLYTVKEETERDLLGTLRAVGQMGYDGVEFAGVPQIPAGEVHAVLDEARLNVAGIVVPMRQLQDRRTFVDAITYNKDIGSPTILFPWLDEPFRQSAKTYQEAAALLDEFGRISSDPGLRFLYHIHCYEFQAYEGKTGLDILMSDTDPANVGLELDTYWVEHGGGDALALYQQYADRCFSIHFKDMNNKQEKRDVEVGDGVIDTRGILRAARGQVADWFIVEQEMFDRPSMESAAISARNLRRLMTEDYDQGE
jgi:sugar phosphate isomerase/epimerase